MSKLFPELAKGQASAQEPVKTVRVASPLTDPIAVRLGPPGQVLQVGESGLETWRQLLGFGRLSVGDRRLQLQSVRLRLEDSRIELGMEGSRIGSAVLQLTPCRVQGKARPRVAVSLAGVIPNASVQRLLIYVQQQLAPACFEMLVKAIGRDPATQPVSVDLAADPRPSTSTSAVEQRFARSVVHTLGGAEAWHVFHVELEQQRNFNHFLSGNILTVRHEDLECNFATPPLRRDRLSFFNYSASHMARPTNHDPEVTTPSWGELTTDLQESDVISGGTDRVDALLDQVANLEIKPELVIVKTSCVPAVTGEDLSGVVARFEERTGVTTVLLDNLADEETDPFSVLLQRLHGASEPGHPGQTDRRINLVGFPFGREMDRLVELLEQVGVHVNARMVPQIQVDALRRLHRAELQVFLDSQLYRASFRQIRGVADIRTLYTTPPYGPNGSRLWLTDVVGELGITADTDRVFDDAWAPFATTWDHLTARARHHRLGFVVDQRAAQLLTDPALSVGIPVLTLLREMGFELELLLYEDVLDPRALPGDQTRFATPKELETLLRDSTASAFYSEFYFDRRLSRSGKAQFSVADFDLGLGGAIATLGRLLRICELPFYRRHGQALGPAFGRTDPHLAPEGAPKSPQEIQ
jgi:Nitrogenase component 1 type Oxidoreductase